ncbi:serine/threonine-protein kinase [Nannocystis pusilla]|uniref:Serine/threonine protein kinase n=1 Tax=Nannocystis pusilla TaxID=889268 RepID=A0ABS7U5J2_9BACT|nr:serine/threonine protein kinase [Nannocystis pusilla]
MGAETEQDHLIGVLFEGRYRVVSRLGGGGMGNVYLAEEIRLRRRCALKVLHPQLQRERSHVERFLREAQIMAQLSHPNIINIFAYGEEPAGVFFVMELLAGEDLESRIRARAERPYGRVECCSWAIHLARALNQVHRSGLVHRDLKASNVFLARQDSDELVKLLDFGIARPVEGSELTGTGVTLGTPNYMSPEQILNEPVDHRTDVYAFGVLLFKMLTGRLPFRGDAIQVTTQHCMTPPPRPSTVAPEVGITPALDAIVLKAMAKRPDERFQSMLEIEQALNVARHGGDSENSSTDPTMRWAAGNSVESAPPPGTSKVSPAVMNLADQTARTPDSRMKDRTARRFTMLAGLGGIALAGVLAAMMLPRQGKIPSTPQVSAEVLVPPTAEKKPVPASPPPDAVEAAPAAAEPGSEDQVPTKLGEPEPPPVSAEAVTETRKRQTRKAGANAVKVDAPADPAVKISKDAGDCRRKFDARDGAKITIDYAVGLDGKVNRSIPSVNDPLGRCLADAVRNAAFPSGRARYGEKISL